MNCFYREEEIHLVDLRDLSVIRAPQYMVNNLSVSQYVYMDGCAPVRLHGWCQLDMNILAPKQRPIRCYPPPPSGHFLKTGNTILIRFQFMGSVPLNNTATVASGNTTARALGAQSWSVEFVEIG
jgi:hypothetical protein